MHEASIILNVLDIAAQYCKREGYAKIDSIRLRIGRASGVMVDALYFAFQAAKADSPAAEASLIVDEIPVGGECNRCKKEFIVNEEYILSCPLCGSSDFLLKTGREMDIMELEVS